MFNKDVFAEKLTVARKAKDYSQKGAARLMKISRSRLAAYEEGRACPPYHVLERILEVYDIEDVESFLFDPVPED